MSKKEVRNTEDKKVETRYDLKMKRRAEAKAKAEREQKISMITGIVVVVLLACFVASFPIRSWLTLNGTYIKVGDEKVTQVEFDYYYNLAKSNYLAQNRFMLAYMGVDTSRDISRQMYSEDMTFQDHFEELAVDSIIQNRALRAEAKAAGFEYDASSDYEEFMDSLKEAAKAAGQSENDFIRENLGKYATASRLKNIMMKNLESSAYYESVAEAKMPGDEEAVAYYEENKDTYDSVDYRITVVKAELPTEPTDLADPVDETEPEAESDAEGSDAEGSDTEEEAYQPSEAEIEFAMKNAKAEADKALKTVKKDGELKENVQRSGVYGDVREWLFDSERKAGDTTIIENSSSHLYNVIAFEKRYLDEAPTYDIRAIVLKDGDGEAVLEEWKSGAATEESFAQLADQYNTAEVSAEEGGYFEALAASSISDELAEWLRDSARVAGDTAVISPEAEELTYVLYYIGTNDAEWMVNIKNTLLADVMTEYLDGITADISVADPKGKLNYLKVYAAREAAESEASAESEGESAESEGAQGAGSEGESTEPEDAEDSGSESGSTEPEDAEGTGSESGSTEPEDAQGAGSEGESTEPEDAEGAGSESGSAGQ